MEPLKDRDKQAIWHPFTSFHTSQSPIPIVKGEGVFLIDENGNKYIDAISSWWVNLHGHAHPYIAEMLYKQALELEQVIFAGFTHRPAIDLAERLLALLPGNLSKIFYSDNGSTAVEVAIKMALQYWWNELSAPHGKKKTTILALKNSYHGDTFGAMSVSDRSVFTLAFQEKLFDVVSLDLPSGDNISSLKDIVLSNAAHTAAFIYEPVVQGAGGMRMYDPSCLNELLEICKQHDILCIADEVMTGFGRTGRFFASEYMDVKPDIICLSKGLTGGTMALGVTACNRKIVDGFDTPDKLKTFFHGHSFTANPLACTAAIASMSLLMQEECLHQIELIAAMNANFAERLHEFPTVKHIRGIGTILAFEFDEGEDEYLNSVSEKITRYMLDKGVYLRPLGNTVYIMPPYCISAEQLNLVYGCVIEFLKESSSM